MIISFVNEDYVLCSFTYEQHHHPISMHPVFDKLEVELVKVAMLLPATKVFEIGSGFPRK